MLEVFDLSSGEKMLHEKIAENPESEDGPEGEGIYTVAFSPDGSRLAVGALGVHLPGIHLWSTRTWKKMRKSLGERDVRGIKYSGDGSLIVGHSIG